MIWIWYDFYQLFFEIFPNVEFQLVISCIVDNCFALNWQWQICLQNLKEEADNDFLKLLRATIKCLTYPEKYFEKLLRLSIKKLGTDERALTRVVTTRAEVDMERIKEEYHRRNSVTLERDIAGDTSGDYERMLLALIGHGDAWSIACGFRRVVLCMNVVIVVVVVLLLLDIIFLTWAIIFACIAYIKYLWNVLCIFSGLIKSLKWTKRSFHNVSTLLKRWEHKDDVRINPFKGLVEFWPCLGLHEEKERIIK